MNFYQKCFFKLNEKWNSQALIFFVLNLNILNVNVELLSELAFQNNLKFEMNLIRTLQTKRTIERERREIQQSVW